MTSPYGRATVIVGPRGSGRPALAEHELDDLLRDSGIEYLLQPALEPGSCRQAARSAVESGCGYLIWVGGDRVLHDVVNGVMGEQGPLNPDLVLAGIPDASGSDFLRTMGLNNPPADAVRHLATEPWFAIDAGRVTWTPGTDPGYGYFINVAQAGMAGEMARRRARLPARAGRFGDLLSFWASLARFGIPKGAVKLDRRSYGGPLTNVVVANGQFVRGGVRLALKAHPGDGKLDVLIEKGNKRDFVESMTLSLSGEHVPSPKIKEFLSARVEISAERPLPVDIDGRLGGFTPAIFELVPGAIRLKI